MRTATLCSLSFVACGVFAQQLAPGKYSGRIEFVGAGVQRNEMVSLSIEEVEGNRLRGVAYLGTPNCRADVPVQGKLDGETLTVWGKGDKGCGIKWQLKVEGDALEGKASGGAAIRMTK